MSNQQKPQAQQEAEPKTRQEAKPKSGKRLEILKACGVSGVPYETGAFAQVPADISEADAKILVRMGRAQWEEQK